MEEVVEKGEGEGGELMASIGRISLLEMRLDGVAVLLRSDLSIILKLSRLTLTHSANEYF